MNRIAKKMVVAACGLLATITSTGAKPQIPLYKQADAPIESRITDLLARMTLEEKILQLNQYILGLNNNVNNIGEAIEHIPPTIGSCIYFSDGAVLRNELQRQAVEQTRLGIPILFGFDVIHGFRTIYPIPLAQGCSWNPGMVREASAMAAREARRSGTEWTFSPMIDVARDGRWGRVAEGYGEDPYTNAVFGAAAVEGYQGDNLASDRTVAACLKHYAAYGLSEGGRDYTRTDVSAQALWETYLPPYQAGVEAGAATIMSAFNDISGTPATANRYLLTDVLRDRWGFDGFVVSDWNAVEQLIAQGVAENRKEAARLAFAAGVDMDMKDDCYRDYMAELVAEGRISGQQIDTAVVRILRLKFRLGLFENPYTPIWAEGERILQSDDRELAARVAEETMVLLKNKGGVLPLEGAKRIALIGPMVKDKHQIIGSWRGHGRDEDSESIFEGMTREFGATCTLLYAEGCAFDGENRSGFDEACAVAAEADVVVLCLGEKSAWSGENASRSTLALPAIQEELAAAVAAVGKPIVLVLSNGRPLELFRLEPLADAIVEMWQPGIAGGTPLAGILSGRVNPSGRLCITFPYATGQIPIYYNARQSARPRQGRYQDIPSRPLYEFGYGLSYTTYTYGPLQTSATTIRRGETVRISVEVRNTGSRDGMETVHWYIRDPFCSISRPVRELKHFEKRLVRKGESETFVWELNPERDLAYTDSQGNRLLEDGDYFIMVGGQQITLNLQ